MKQIANFYTWFWIIYFPVCIAFTVVVDFDFSDELLTIALLSYAMTKRRYLVKDKKRKSEVNAYILIMFFYLIYSFIIGITSTRGILLDILQQIRPYAVFYLTWMMAPNFTQKQKRMIITIMLGSFFLYIYLFYTNRTIVTGAWAEGDAAFGQLALCCAMIYSIFTEHNKKNRYLSLCIILLGLIANKSKYIGECIVFITLTFFVNEKVKYNSPTLYIKTSLLASVVLFFTWVKFNAYYVEGMQDETESMARPMTYKTGLQIMIDYIPFGSGLGTFGCAAAAKEYSPLYYEYHLDNIWGLTPENPNFLADTFYPIVYAQFGIIGTLFFLIFWKRRLSETNKIIDLYHYKMALMCILALALESTADSSYLSGKGMGYFMILAVCLNSNRNYKIIEKRQKLLEEAQKKQETQTFSLLQL